MTTARFPLLVALALAAALGACRCGPEDSADDAGPPDAHLDAGGDDAGLPDAGTDAGVPDAGVPDAGVDAGSPDAGVDAGVQDAGLPDAGSDAGAGPMDGGAFCVDGWCWQRPTQFGATLFAAWGSAPDDVWAVGAGGTVVHFDGQAWRLVATGVWADLFAVWGAARDDVWAVGAGGTILHFNGSTWTSVASPTTKALNGVHGTGPGDVYAVGDEDTRLHWNGAQWTALPTLYPAAGLKPHQYGVWAGAGGEVWSAGIPWLMAIPHRTDGGWTTTEVDYFNTTTVFRAVWGSSPQDVWLVANPSGQGGLQRWDGQAWRAVYPPTNANFWNSVAIAGSGPSDVWFFGGWGGSGHWNGSTFVPVPELQEEYLTGGWVHPSGAGWTVGYGGRMARKTALDGGWTFISGSPSGGYDSLSQVTVLSENDAWAVGRLSLAHWDGTRWTDVEPAPTNYRQEFTDVWGAAPNDVWAVAWGSASPDNLQHWNGTAWSTTPHPGATYLNAVWGSAANDVWIAAENGGGLHWNGTAWQVAATGPGSALALHGTAADDVWSVGRSGVIRRYDGTAWSAKTSGTTEDLYAVRAFSRTDAWAAGENATLRRWNGTTWVAAPSMPPLAADSTGRRAITGLSGTSSQDLWLCTTAGEVFRFDGSAWTRSTRLPVGLSALARTPAGALFTVGGNGSILRRAP